MIHLGDITKISGYDVPITDVVIGGSPCQDLSIAGKQEGLSGARSGLFMEQVRIVKEMRDADRARNAGKFIRPRYLVWENVPGAFSSNKGKDFQQVLSECVRIAEPSAPDVPLPPKGKWTKAGLLMGDGWSLAWRVLDAQFWGVPQRRRRVCLVCDFAGDSAGEILFVRDSLSGDSSQSGAAGERTAAGVESGTDRTVWCLQGNGIGRADTAGCEGRGWNENIAFTLSAQDRHCVCVYPEVARSLTARYDGSPCADRGPNIVVTYDARGNGDGKTVCTLTGDHANRVTDYTPIVMGFKWHQGTGGLGEQVEVYPTLTADGPSAVIKTYSQQGFGDYKESAVLSSYKARDGKDATDLVCVERPIAAIGFDLAQITSKANGSKGALEKAYSMAAGGNPAVVYGLDSECNAYPDSYGTLRAHSSGGAKKEFSHNLLSGA